MVLKIYLNNNIVEIVKSISTHHPLSVYEPVGGDGCVTLHTPGQVELVAVETLHLAGQERGGRVT